MTWATHTLNFDQFWAGLVQNFGELLWNYAIVISVCDLQDQVPSVDWLQFWPKTTTAKAALHHTRCFKVRFRVQHSQWRKEHHNTHYAAGVFCYHCEYAVKSRNNCSSVCLDDKQQIKLGDHAFPLATAVRGWEVLMTARSWFLVRDHDFTAFSIIPLVILHVDIPGDIWGSW